MLPASAIKETNSNLFKYENRKVLIKNVSCQAELKENTQQLKTIFWLISRREFDSHQSNKAVV